MPAARTTQGEDVMNEIKSAQIYRVCAVSDDRWDVYQEPKGHPVASFSEKAAALNYAMCLARGRAAWHLLLTAPEAAGSHASLAGARHQSATAQH
jgi:hypothetical protein